ncbi:MAG TPA: TIGR03085 family metal-binding protein [Pseudonocardiaceae bacterium]
MGERTLAATERAALCDLMAEVGPDAPTLCTGWTTRDLAAHLIVREGRPDAAPGILLPPLAWYADRVQQATAKRDWPELVEQVRSGPPWYSPMRLSAAAERINGVEFYVHHEDVLRARPGWQPRAADPDRAEELWSMLGRLGRMTYRRAPVGVVVRRPDGAERTLRSGSRSVTVVGPPDELILHAYGRGEAVVEFDGDQTDIGRLEESPRGF